MHASEVFKRTFMNARSRRCADVVIGVGVCRAQHTNAFRSQKAPPSVTETEMSHARANNVCMCVCMCEHVRVLFVRCIASAM